MLKIFLLFTLSLLKFLTSTAQTYTWTNRTSIKVTVNFKYDRPVGNVLLSKEFNPGESLAFNNLSGTVTQAIISGGGFWSGKFAILYMGNCPTCHAPGNYDILTPPPPQQPKPPVQQPQRPSLPVPQPPPQQQQNPPQQAQSLSPAVSLLGDFRVRIRKDANLVYDAGNKGLLFFPSITIKNGIGKKIHFIVELKYSQTLAPESAFLKYNKDVDYTCEDIETTPTRFYIFIPYKDLNVTPSKKYYISARVSIHEGGNPLKYSNWEEFSFTYNPGAQFGAH